MEQTALETLSARDPYGEFGAKLTENATSQQAQFESRRQQEQRQAMLSRRSRLEQLDNKQERLRAERREHAMKKRMELKNSIEAFLAERVAYKAEQQTQSRRQEALELQRKLAEEEYWANLEAEEAAEMVADFERRMRILSRQHLPVSMQALFQDAESDSGALWRGLRINGDGSWPPEVSSVSHVLRDVICDTEVADTALPTGALSSASLDDMIGFDYSANPGSDRTAPDALSFLKIVYNPPPPFDAVIARHEIAKLDAVFSMLLRLLQADEAMNRVGSGPVWRQLKTAPRVAEPLASDLTRAERALVVQLHYGCRVLVRALMAYSFDSVVRTAWTQLRVLLDSVASRMHHSASAADGKKQGEVVRGGEIARAIPHPEEPTFEGDDEVLRIAQSINSLGALRGAVSRTVADMRDRLFLGTQHRQVRETCDTLVQLALKFSRKMLGYPISESFASLHAAFSVRRGLLVTALQAIAERTDADSTDIQAHGHRFGGLPLGAELLTALDPLA
ncbi:hypothetical protein HK105_206255 [Polyrhizophydium stewartii]|uniref:Gamma tubulin complex component C-terminal domain-containing protein n=1 Tax=Polyrhizophydium stewartii TaxID=2732419 RepID=A0ABR4N3U7_9FUNG